jgi:uncharacterized membrane protein affecting hemolysin expression
MFEFQSLIGDFRHSGSQSEAERKHSPRLDEVGNQSIQAARVIDPSIYVKNSKCLAVDGQVRSEVGRSLCLFPLAPANAGF